MTRTGWAKRIVGGLAAGVLVASGWVAVGPVTAQAAVAPPVVHVSGNTLVDGSGRPLRLLGVNRSGAEYACIQGWGTFDGPTDAASIAAITSWHTNVVRMGLNEDCWLDINDAGLDSANLGANYRQSIVGYVNRLHAAGLAVILELHANAPGTTRADTFQKMPDADHSPAFWTSVATTFKNDPSVIFDVFNEPHLVDWNCWRNGCAISGVDTSGGTVAGTWTAASMGSLVSAVRTTGATQPIMLGGLQWANDLSQWLANEPTDTLNPPQLVASFHLYNDNACAGDTCWDGQVGSVAQQVPVVTGENGQYDCNHDFVDQYMRWADRHGISYLGWTWNADGWTCTGGPSLISDYNGTPTNFGIGLRDHLAAVSRAMRTPVDFDSDGRTDLSVWRPSIGAWLAQDSTTASLDQSYFGLSTDIPVPADYDGVARNELAVYRPSTGAWFVKHPGTGAIAQTYFGNGTDDLPVPADYDGDGRVDLAVYRPSAGLWLVRQSSNGAVVSRYFGASGNGDTPAPGDFDGDGRADLAVYRQAAGLWFVLRSSDGVVDQTRWGNTTSDVPVVGDYDGDGRADVAVYRPGTGAWFVVHSTGGTTQQYFGNGTNDVPQPGDYDNDGVTDMAVYRPSTGLWLERWSGGGTPTVHQSYWGNGTNDVALALPYVVRSRFFGTI